MVRIGQESLHRITLRRLVEEVTGCLDQSLVANPGAPYLDVRHAARLMPIARRRLLSESIANWMISLSVCPYSVT